MNLISEPLKNILIIGGGKIAYYLAKTLISKKYKVKLIENNEERAVELAESLPKATIICGDGTDHDLLVEEGIETTDSCIALTNIDEENIPELEMVSGYDLQKASKCPVLPLLASPIKIT